MSGPRCDHTGRITGALPDSPDSCRKCVAAGDEWVHLRVCLTCGHVGCCDNSKNRHASGHFHASAHPIIQSYEPGEGWRFCYIDKMVIGKAEPLR
jgi:uncharacterized UBP type Zn finger protein